MGIVAVATLLGAAAAAQANGVAADSSVHVSFPIPGPVTTGTFDTEMLSMDLVGGPVMIRESPTKASLGRTQITGAPGGLYHIDSFFDIFTELSLDGGGSWSPPGGPVALPTGTFDTEMLSMRLMLPGPVMIRESPTRASQGRTSITGIGGGQYRIDSFFDIFTELSLDGGQTWTPSPDAGRLMQGPVVPLPPAVWGGAIMLAGVVLKRRLANKA